MATISEPAANSWIPAGHQTWGLDARLLRWLTVIWIAMGLVMLFSASYPIAQRTTGDGFYFVRLQLMWVGLRSLIAWIIVRIPMRIMLKLAPLFFVVGLALVLATHVPGMGVQRLDATRWLKLLPFLPTIQPSEFLKPALVLQGALVFGTWFQRSMPYRLLWLALFGLALLSILTQPNLGTTAICGLTLWLMAWLGGLPILTLLGAAAGGAGLAIGSILVKDYQRRRILAFLDPWASPQGDGYQLVQSLMAIGSGGIWGRGFGLSQQKLFYLPIQYTDFIFSVYAEEFGMVGSLFFLGLLAAYTLVGWRVMEQCRDLPSKLVAGGCLGFLVGQSAMNLGVVSGALPTTGVPLPLFSHGGSSMLAGMVMAALLVRVAREAHGGRLVPNHRRRDPRVSQEPTVRAELSSITIETRPGFRPLPSADPNLPRDGAIPPLSRNADYRL
ncbi:MAG: FtsW/RodA/SpoVE family cell cycle protein [Cyanophyceae cyanobacterium]